VQATSKDGKTPNPADFSVSASRYVLFFSIAVIGCAADLVSKDLVFDWLGWPVGKSPQWVWEGFFGFETAVNRGALFGMGQGMSAWFAVLSVIAAAGIIIWLFVLKGARDKLLTVSLGCVTAGIFGNLYDRLGIAGEEYQNGVRDWILFRFRDYNWPNFNIADCLLVCGAMLLFFHAFTQPKEGGDSKPTNSARASKEPPV
jgi:signal peptidase II